MINCTAAIGNKEVTVTPSRKGIQNTPNFINGKKYIEPKDYT